MISDPGYFGPNSMMWKVNKEITVLFGGARALLMHAAHPLIAAGARQTSFYQRDPWKRLIRTLSLQNSVTFGTKEEADESAHRINKLHEVIKGEDGVTGLIYDALDHEQLLWVHACLQISSIFFYEKTVKKLSSEEKDTYHRENMKAAGLVLVDTSRMPDTHDGLKQWVIEKSREKDYFLLCDDVCIYTAAQLLSLPNIPVLIRPSTPVGQNPIQRLLDEGNNNPIVLAQTYNKIMIDFQLTQEELSQKIKKSRSRRLLMITRSHRRTTVWCRTSRGRGRWLWSPKYQCSTNEAHR